MNATIEEKTFQEVLQEQHEQNLAKQRALALLPETAVQLHQDVEQMGVLLARMGQVIGAMQRRMDEMEARQAAATISHEDVKRLQAKIRWRADAICGKYVLRDPESARKFRAAIKKDVLARYQVKDLHDLQAAMLPAAHKQIESWTDIRLVMERRGTT
jgi:hypothetical protein